MIKKILTIFIIYTSVFAQANDIEVFLIDSFVESSNKPILKITFFTSEPCFSKIKINNQFEYSLSDSLIEEHKYKIKLSDINIQHDFTYEILLSKNQHFKVYSKEEILLSDEIKTDLNSSYSLFKMCCVGGIVFGLPSPQLIMQNGEKYFSLTKQIPILKFYSQNFSEPSSFLSVEYTYIFNDEKTQLFRINYDKYYYKLPIKYVAPGISLFTDFKGYNSVGISVACGLLQLSNVFDLFVKYRYNFNLNKTHKSFSEFTIGINSNFFSINL